MPITYSIDPEADVIVFRLLGDFDFEEVRRLWEKIPTNPLYHKGMNAFWDIRHGTLRSLTQAGVYAIRDAIFEFAEIRGRCKVAVSVASELDYGMTRMLQIVCEQTDLVIKGFRDHEEAVRWIGEPLGDDEPVR